MIGTTLCHYRVLEKLGAGGMGEVYRAEDTTLGRQVAIKVLPDAFSREAERLARFEREAKVLASLNHPNIAAIYGLEEAVGRRFLVLELVEGETLAQRINRKPLPLEEALEVCRQIAEGLEAAHEKGVIHRDLKPANVKITPEGKVKILDFGLAKAFHEQSSTAVLEDSPTITEGMTRPGVVLGTAAYMAPEQAKGQAVDKRVDVWAFGCVLYECLSGKRAFPGESITEVLARILEVEPDWALVPPNTSAVIRALLRRCLQKDRNRRQHDIVDVRIEIEETLAAPTDSSSAQLRRGVVGPRWRWAAPWALAGLATIIEVVALWSPWRSRSLPAAQPTRFAVSLPQGETIATTGPGSAVALSPDGTRLAYVVRRGTTNHLCLLRPSEEFAAKTIPGAEGAQAPFFSPDGNWLGFWAEGKLKKVSLLSGASHTICQAHLGGNACWLEDDTIVFGDSRQYGMWRVSASGGEPKRLTTSMRLSATVRDLLHLHPHPLPQGTGLLFSILNFGGQDIIAAFSFETGAYQPLLEGGTHPHYLESGYLVYQAADRLMAVAFDPRGLKVTGPMVPILAGVTSGHFSVSPKGSLAYVPGGAVQKPMSKLVRVDRAGKAEALPFPKGRYQSPRIAPDGEQLLIVRYDRLPNVWLYGLAKGSQRRFTDDRGTVWWVLWSPDGKEVVFNSDLDGPIVDLYSKPVDGGVPERRLTTNQLHLAPNCWADGGKKVLALEHINPSTGYDIVSVPYQRPGTPEPILKTHFNEFNPEVSPNGQWLAYVSDESGRYEVYLKPYPGPGRTIPVTTEGGIGPVWDPSGQTLYYRDETGHKLYQVPIVTEPSVQAGSAELVFEGRFAGDGIYGRMYDISPKGDFFIMVQEDESQPATQINVILNWSEELKRLGVARK